MTDPILHALDDLRAEHPGYRWPCCTLVARLLMRAYGLRESPGGPWWAAVNVWDRRKPWSAIDAIAERPGGEIVTTPRPGSWHAVQGWRRLDMLGHVDAESRGHTWLWWALTPETGLCLESSVDLGIRWGGASLREMCGPGESWADRIAPYAAGVRLAVLTPVSSGMT